MRKIFLPRYCDEQMMLLYWSADELLPGITLFLLGILINQKLLGLIGAVIVIRLYRKMKEGKPDGFLLHFLYWWGIINPKTKLFPNPYIREYLP